MRSTQAHSYLGSLICAVIQVCPLEKSSGCLRDRKSTRLNSSHLVISYAVFCLKKKKEIRTGSDSSPNSNEHRSASSWRRSSHGRGSSCTDFKDTSMTCLSVRPAGIGESENRLC